MEKKLKLIEPVEFKDAKITELTFRPMRAKDYMGVEMRRFGLAEWAAEDCIRIISNNTNMPIEVIRELSSDDFHAAISMILDFFDGASPAPSSEELPSQSGEPSSSSSPESSLPT